MLQIGIIFHRLGPYHVARLRAAGAAITVTAIETSGADYTYAWDVVPGAQGFERFTLFSNADAQKLPAGEVARGMAIALDKIRPQVVVVPGWADAAALGALRWCLNEEVPAVVMSESTEWDEKRSAVKEWVKGQVVGLFSAGLAGGRPHADYLAQLGMPRERIFLGYDAVDNGYFVEKVEKLKAEMLKSESGDTSSGRRAPSPQGGEGERRYFLASNRFVKKKNLPRLLQAYSRYRDLGEKAETLKTERLKAETRRTQLWDLVVLGDGELRPEIERLRSSLGLEGVVQLPGFKQYPELPSYYAKAGAFVHASTTEQWGLVVNEAMASGLPVVVSNRCGCAEDLVQEGVNGFTFDPYNVEGLAELMWRVSAPGFPLADFGAASQRIVADWGPERFAAGLKGAVEKALEVGPIRPSWWQRMILAGLLRS